MTSFQEKVYQFTKMIPPGWVATYGQLATAIGRPKAFRAVGNALNRNPYSPDVPCHRVVKNNGELGGYAFGVIKKKIRLKQEGVVIKNGKVVNFHQKKFYFPFPLAKR